jgi:predicted RNA-binding Zn ribbon-like protein
LVESDRRDIATLDRCGGDLALDFANTLGGLREGPWDDEWLHGYEDLADWARHAGALAPSDAAALRRRAAAQPRAAAAAYARAIALREQIHRVMAAVAAGDAPAAADLDALRAAHAGAVAHAALAIRGDRAEFTWSGDALDRPLWPVALSAVDLLRSDRLARLKQCRNCRWLFLDASKNASRRWCSMAHCGTGAKVAATRARRRTARPRP